MMKNKIIITIAAIGLLLFVIKGKDMNWRQSVMKTLYPAIRKAAELLGSNNTIAFNDKHDVPHQSFYNLSASGITGDKISFEQFRGKKVLLVNTASNCGYTGQLEELQKLQEDFAGRLVVIGFPANDFKNQEVGSNEEIATFCRKNYGVKFLMSEKSTVVKSIEQHPVFQWLTKKEKNGWNEIQPEWNFGKYLVDEKGVLINYFGPAISPLSNEVVRNLQ